MWLFDLFIHKPLKRQAKFVADNILNILFIFSEKKSLDISARLMIHMKYQDFILWEKENKNYFLLLLWLAV